MEIILSILQILVIILLVLIGIILLVLLIVLFVPIRYQISGKIEEKTSFEGKLFGLLHLLRAKVSYIDESFYVEVGIFWKKLSFPQKIQDPNELSDEESTTKDSDEAISENKSNEDLQESTTEDSATNKDTGITGKHDTDKKESVLKKLTTILHNIKNKISFLREKATQIKKILQDDKNKQAMKHLKDEVFYLFKILLPRKSYLNGIFSTGSPDTTGQIFGVLCCFPIIYQDDWNLTPDFEAEKAYFKGEFQGKGRIYIFQLVGILIRIIIDKNCRRLYYVLNKLGGRNNGGRK